GQQPLLPVDPTDRGTHQWTERWPADPERRCDQDQPVLSYGRGTIPGAALRSRGGLLLVRDRGAAVATKVTRAMAMAAKPTCSSVATPSRTPAAMSRTRTGPSLPTRATWSSIRAPDRSTRRSLVSVQVTRSGSIRAMATTTLRVAAARSVH